jgi:hypothetical protein
MRLIVPLLFAAIACFGEVHFRAQEIQRDFGIGYAVVIADVNGDHKPDIVAINPTQVVWFENPTWEKHVILDGGTKHDNVSIAAEDIDGDGKVDFAIGADWQSTNTLGGGSLQWIGTKTGPWKVIPLGEEPTLHRIKWGDVDGDGRHELIVAPLHGRATKGPKWEEGQGSRILVFHIPKDPVHEPWPMEVADDSLHIVHNFLVTNFDDGEEQQILTASTEGIHVLHREVDGTWRKQRIGEGSPGEIKLGHVGGKRILATVTPWHGNSIVLYEEAVGLWPRKVIEESLTGGHALGWGDFDGDGDDELAVGWREKKGGVALYKRAADGSWKKEMVDDGGMATEDVAVADLDGDGRPEIIAVGRATGNVKIYWNESARR